MEILHAEGNEIGAKSEISGMTKAEYASRPHQEMQAGGKQDEYESFDHQCDAVVAEQRRRKHDEDDAQSPAGPLLPAAGRQHGIVSLPRIADQHLGPSGKTVGPKHQHHGHDDE